MDPDIEGEGRLGRRRRGLRGEYVQGVLDTGCPRVGQEDARRRRCSCRAGTAGISSDDVVATVLYCCSVAVVMYVYYAVKSGWRTQDN